jgi:hypothetical protein
MYGILYERSRFGIGALRATLDNSLDDFLETESSELGCVCIDQYRACAVGRLWRRIAESIQRIGHKFQLIQREW